MTREELLQILWWLKGYIVALENDGMVSLSREHVESIKAVILMATDKKETKKIELAESL